MKKSRELGPLNLEKRRLRGILPMCTRTDGGRRADGARLFSVLLGDGTRSTDHSLKHGKFHLKLRKTLFALRMVNTNHLAQGGCGVSILGDNQSPAGHYPGLPAVAEPALSRGLD